MIFYRRWYLLLHFNVFDKRHCITGFRNIQIDSIKSSAENERIWAKHQFRQEKITRIIRLLLQAAYCYFHKCCSGLFDLLKKLVRLDLPFSALFIGSCSSKLVHLWAKDRKAKKQFSTHGPYAQSALVFSLFLFLANFNSNVTGCPRKRLLNAFRW